MRTLAARVVPLFIAAILGGLFAAWFARPPQQPALSPANLAALEALTASGDVRGEEVTQMPAAARIELGGYVEPRNLTHLSAQAPGRIAYIAGQEGDAVAGGQLVAALDDDALRPEYRAAWAGLASDMAGAENAQTQLYHNLYGPKTTSSMGGPFADAFERVATPFYNMAQGFMGQVAPGAAASPNSPFGYAPVQTQQQAQRGYPAINNARADYERQLAGLVGSQARIDSLDARLRDRRSIAPRGGVILRRYVRLGDVVQPGQPIADIADVDALDIRIEAPLAQIKQIALGDAVPVTVNSVNVWAKVAQIFPSAEGPQRTVTVKLALPPGVAAAVGMYARVWIAQPGGGGPSMLTPAIPTHAIVYRGSLPVAFVVTPHGAEMRVLRLGDEMGDRTAVLSGLRAGERVMSNPPFTQGAESASSIAQ